MSSKYDSMNHSKFLLRYHIIFVCKYRKKLLMHLGETIKNMMYDISLSSDFIIEEMEVDKDHIHLSKIPWLFHYEPVTALPNFHWLSSYNTPAFLTFKYLRPCSDIIIAGKP